MICADLKPEAPIEEVVPTHELIGQRYGMDKAAFVATNVTVADDMAACVGEAVEKAGKLNMWVLVRLVPSVDI